MKIWQSQDFNWKISKHIKKSNKCLLESETVSKSSKLPCCNDFEEEEFRTGLFYSFGGFFFAVFWLFIFLKGTFWFVTLFSIFITVLIRSGYSNVFCKKAVSNIFCNICKKEPVSETFFTNVVGSVPVFLRKGDFWHSYFTLKFAKYFWTPFL